MMKKIVIFLTVLAFACSSLLLMTSCTKKHMKEDEGVTSTPEEKPPHRVAEDATDAAGRAQAAREAKLREQKLQEEMQAFMSKNIYFDFDRSELKPAAQANLAKKAEWLRRNPTFFVRIEGHCDERGTNEYNLALGERRANAAKKYLMDLGISANRLRTMSYGEERSADPGHDEEAWHKNRRDEFKLVK